MKHAILCIKDRVANQYKPPMTYPNVNMAIREFGDGVNNTARDNLMNKHPDDFDLYLVGEFDDETGAIDKLQVPMQVALGKEHKVNDEGPIDLFNKRNHVA